MSKNSNNSKPQRQVRKVHFDLHTKLEIDNDDDEKYKTVNQLQSNQFEQHPNKFVITARKDEKKVHGTANYVDGTLNFSTADYKTVVPNKVESCTTTKSTESSPIMFRNEFTNDTSAKNARKNCSIDQQGDNAVNRRRILVHMSSEHQEANNITFHKIWVRRYTSVLMRVVYL